MVVRAFCTLGRVKYGMSGYLDPKSKMLRLMVNESRRGNRPMSSRSLYIFHDFLS